ncbi:MAG: helix-turn-helix domain-containing protein [Acidobacteriota bacterium]|nr:helix-turn-helix domain-containing protein [Acidobacteriota bacterium]
MTSTLRSTDEMWRPVERLLLEKRSSLLGMLGSFGNELAEDALQEASVKAYVMVRKATTPQEQAQVASRLASLSFWRRMLTNTAIDITRKRHDRSCGPLEDADGRPVEIRDDRLMDSFSAVIRQVDRDDTVEVVSRLAGTLIARSADRPTRRVRITRQDWITFSKAAVLAGEHGNQSAIAKELGVGRATVSERLQRVREALQLTHYLVGVLGAACLTDEELVNEQLDTFEAFDGAQQEHSVRLKEACPHVLTSPTTGTRVNASHYTASRPDEPDAVEQLHAAESSWATAVSNAYPNCVTICQPHNPRPGRKTELSNVR